MSKAAKVDMKDAGPALLAAAQSSRNPERNTALVLLQASLGARPCELATLAWSALLGADGMLTGFCTWQTRKGGKVRTESLSEHVLEALKAILPARLDRGAPVFVSERGEAFSEESMGLIIRNLFKGAKLAGSAYSIRHVILKRKAKRVMAEGGTGADLLAETGQKWLTSVQHYLDEESKVRAAVQAGGVQDVGEWFAGAV